MSVNTIINQAVTTSVQAQIQKAGFDRTRTGRIVGVNQNNTYSVKVDNVTYPNVSVYGEGKIITGDFVKVVYPCNQVSQMYIDMCVVSADVELQWGVKSESNVPLQLNNGDKTSQVIISNGNGIETTVTDDKLLFEVSDPLVLDEINATNGNFGTTVNTGTAIYNDDILINDTELETLWNSVFGSE